MLSELFSPIIDMLKEMAHVVPLPIFTFGGAFIEEVVAPIPSPLVMTLAGTLAAGDNQPMQMLLWLALIGAVGKTLGSYLVYVIADKAEDIVIGKLGKFVGVSHKEVEQFGSYLNHGKRDDIVLLILRALPIVPTAPVSLVCGLIKINLTTYLRSTFFGTLIRNMFYLYLGYTSLGALESLNGGLDSMESIGYVIIALLLGLLTLFFFSQRQKDGGMSALQKLFKTKAK